MILSRKTVPIIEFGIQFEFIVMIQVAPISITPSTVITVGCFYRGTGISSGYSRQLCEMNAGIKDFFREFLSVLSLPAIMKILY